MAKFPPLIISALLYHCFSRLSRRVLLFFGHSGGFFCPGAPKPAREAAFCRFRGRGNGGFRVQDILHPRWRRTLSNENRDAASKKPAPIPRAGDQGRFFSFLGNGQLFFSCRETRSIMRA